jgi:hypothetical protein
MGRQAEREERTWVKGLFSERDGFSPPSASPVSCKRIICNYETLFLCEKSFLREKGTSKGAKGSFFSLQ